MPGPTFRRAERIVGSVAWVLSCASRMRWSSVRRMGDAETFAVSERWWLSGPQLDAYVRHVAS